MAPDRALQPYATRHDAEITWRVLDALRDIASRHDESVATVAVAWLLGRPHVSSVLIGVRNVEQLASIVGAGTIALDGRDIDTLDQASAPANPGYPYDASALWQRTRRLEGGR